MRRALMPLIALGLVSVLGLRCGGDNNNANTQAWQATLTGAAETPPVATLASGTADFTMDNDGNDHIHFHINAVNFTNLTVGHIHAGDIGKPGPIIVALIANTPPVSGSREFDGEIQLEDIEVNNNGIATLADLRQQMSQGKLYVNLHTSANPLGEIRGQIGERTN
jgi:CHRD domain-containing protein